MLLGLIGRRALAAVVLVLLASVLVFVLMEIIPGDPAYFVVGKDASPAVLHQVREALGLDRPATTRYLLWLSHAVRGDFGQSAVLLNGNLNAYLAEHAKNTAILCAVTLALMVPLSLFLGAVAAVRRDGFVDHFISGAALLTVGFPEFVVAILLVELFAVHFHVLPAIATFPDAPSIANWARSLVLPVATLLIVSLPETIRLMRGSLIEVLDSEYIEAVRLRGIPERRVICLHAIPNALGPAIQLLALNAAWLIGGVVIVENIFNYPGLGQAVTSALTEHDIPVVQSIVCGLVLAYVVITTLADVANLLLTPRMRGSSSG